MVQTLEDARKLAHGTYDDVIVAEHRPHASQALQVVLEMPEGSRVLDVSREYEIDGVVGSTAPALGRSYRLIVAPFTGHVGRTEATPNSTLRYETMNR